jgi:hypothetical protein
VTDILATTPDKRNRHLERIVTYRDRHYYGNVTEVTDTNEGTITDRDRHSIETKCIALFRFVTNNSSYIVFHILIPQYCAKNCFIGDSKAN